MHLERASRPIPNQRKPISAKNVNANKSGKNKDLLDSCREKSIMEGDKYIKISCTYCGTYNI